jgi:signal transduction histidine kinase
MTYLRSTRSMFRLSNIFGANLFGFPNARARRKPDRIPPDPAVGTSRGATVGRVLRWCSGPWPLTARVPIVSGALILFVAVVVSRVMMSSVAHEQELGVRQIAAVYIDGIATTIYPHVVGRNLTNTIEALRRTMWFHQGMREQRAIVRLPDGTVFADVSGPNGDVGTEDPLRDAALRRQLDQEGGFVFDGHNATGWISRAIEHEGNHVAELYVAVELKALLAERQAVRRKLLLATVLAGLGAAAIGVLVVRRMVLPIRLLTERLRRAQTGDFEQLSLALMPPASSEYGRLLRGYNDLVDAIGEREALAARLAQRERESVLGRLAATLAHEVRNPLGGMSTALNTVRKFGDDLSIRAKSLDLIERGLWSIGDVVNSVLAFHRMPPDSRRLTPNDLDDLRVLIESALARRQLRLAWDCNIERNVNVAATETRQIALNLLLNACEASPNGGEVSFRAWIDHDGNKSGSSLVLQVMDGGPGLPDTITAALAEPGKTEAQGPSSGLGIHVVRDLVRGLGGGIVATTASDHAGSCVFVTLPVEDEGAREMPA